METPVPLTPAAATRHRRWRLSALLAVALVSVTLPRIGVLKFTECLALLGTPRALASRQLQSLLLRSLGPFAFASLVALATALFMLGVGVGDQSLGSDKAIYSSPLLVPLINAARILIYIGCLASLTHFFLTAAPRQTRLALDGAYAVALLPGLLQMLRIYSGVHFNLPFERPDVGPFSGVFDAGYLRLMGFEFEPLAYATSLVVMCCVRLHARARVPWLGLGVLLHTFSAGALGGLVLALAASRLRLVVRWFVPLYATAAALLFWYVYVEFDALTELFLPLTSVMERLTAIRACVGMLLDHPFGVGLGLYGYHFNLYNPLGLYQAESLDHYPNNDLAMFLAYGGLLLAAAYLHAFHFVIRRCRSYWLLVAVLALMIQSFSSYLFFNPALLLVFSLILAGARPLQAGAARTA